MPFADLFKLSTYLLPRSFLPPLPSLLRRKLSVINVPELESKESEEEWLCLTCAISWLKFIEILIDAAIQVLDYYFVCHVCRVGKLTSVEYLCLSWDFIMLWFIRKFKDCFCQTQCARRSCVHTAFFSWYNQTDRRTCVAQVNTVAKPTGVTDDKIGFCSWQCLSLLICILWVVRGCSILCQSENLASLVSGVSHSRAMRAEDHKKNMPQVVPQKYRTSQPVCLHANLDIMEAERCLLVLSVSAFGVQFVIWYCWKNAFHTYSFWFCGMDDSIWQIL